MLDLILRLRVLALQMFDRHVNLIHMYFHLFLESFEFLVDEGLELLLLDFAVEIFVKIAQDFLDYVFLRFVVWSTIRIFTV